MTIQSYYGTSKTCFNFTVNRRASYQSVFRADISITEAGLV